MKDVLSKLKAKTVSSQKRYADLAKSNLARLLGILAKVQSFAQENTNDELMSLYANTLKELLEMIKTDVYMIVDESLNALLDYKLYTESLEDYFSEIDKAVKEAIEQGKKEGEEQIKQQEELSKKGTDYIK